MDPRFGTEAELKALVDDAHARGIKVLLDVVYNHAGYDSSTSPRTRRPQGWLRTEALGTCGQDDLTSCVSGLPDFKTELPEVADYLLDAQLGLAEAGRAWTASGWTRSSTWTTPSGRSTGAGSASRSARTSS